LLFFLAGMITQCLLEAEDVLLQLEAEHVLLQLEAENVFLLLPSLECGMY
jgi:hypothetical protein